MKMDKHFEKFTTKQKVVCALIATIGIYFLVPLELFVFVVIVFFISIYASTLRTRNDQQISKPFLVLFIILLTSAGLIGAAIVHAVKQTGFTSLLDFKKASDVATLSVPILSFLTVVWLMYERYENNIRYNENKNSQEKKNLNDQFYRHLDYYRNQVSSIRMQPSDEDEVISIEGHQVFVRLFRQMQKASELLNSLQLELSPFQHLKVVGNVVYYGLGLEEKSIINDKLSQTIPKRRLRFFIIDFFDSIPANYEKIHCKKYFSAKKQWSKIENREQKVFLGEYMKQYSDELNQELEYDVQFIDFKNKHLSNKIITQQDWRNKPYIHYYGGHQHRLGHYFSMIHILFDLIVNSTFLTSEEKADYIDIFKAQLSTHEKFVTSLLLLSFRDKNIRFEWLCDNWFYYKVYEGDIENLKKCRNLEEIYNNFIK